MKINVGTWRYFSYPPATVYAIRELARRRRISLKKKVASGNSKQSKRRFSNEKAREIIRLYKRRRYILQDPVALTAKFRKSILADGFFPRRSAARWMPMISRSISQHAGVVKLRNFNFIENPEGVCEALHKLCELESTCAEIRLDFEDEYCLDIGAYLVLSALKKDMAPVFSGGAIRPSIMKVLEAVRLREELGMRRNPKAALVSDLWAFPTVSRRPAGSSRSATRFLEPQSIEKVATALVLAINEWLGTIVDQELTEEGRRLVQKMVGEVLDNAERHSAPLKDGDWAISGFLAKRTIDGRQVFRCHLGFLNTGKTISESFASANSEIQAQVGAYVSKHTSVLSKAQEQERLMCVFALQDGVTTDPNAFEEGRGGTGLQDVIQFFDNLAGADNPEHDAQLAIISGRTHIKIKYPYNKGIMDANGRRRLWLNHENSPNSSPSNEHVTIMPYRLNGTLVTAAFNLEKEYLESSIDG